MASSVQSPIRVTVVVLLLAGCLLAHAGSSSGNSGTGPLNTPSLSPGNLLRPAGDIASLSYAHEGRWVVLTSPSWVNTWNVVHYPSAAPTFFPAVDGYIDGGVFANNPSMAALSQTQDHRALKTPPRHDRIALLSIGTGTSLMRIERKNLDWGQAQWIKPLLNIMMDGVMGVADYQFEPGRPVAPEREARRRRG